MTLKSSDGVERSLPTVGASRTIYFAHGDPSSRQILHTMLETLDHDVPLVTDSGAKFIERATEEPADVLIAAPRLSDMDGIEALIRIGNRRPTPSIVIAKQGDIEMVERAMDDHVMAYLVEPVTTDVLMPAIYLCERRFEHFQRLREQIADLEQRLEDRKLVERAKGILMNAKNISEADAHQLIQKSAKKSRKRMAEIAQSIVDTGEIMNCE